MEPSVDLGNIITLEHINLEVTQADVATIFYMQGLGLTRDPFERVGPTLQWANVGSQQFHLRASKGGVSDGEDDIGGLIGIVVPSLSFVKQQLESVEEKLQHTQFRYKHVHVDFHKKDCYYIPNISEYMLVTSPGGKNRFFIVQNNEKIDMRGGLGIPFLEFYVKKDCCPKIVRFYQTYFKAYAEEAKHPEDGGPIAIIHVGINQVLIFREVADYAVPPHKWNTWHICFYIAEFAPLYHKAVEDDVIFYGQEANPDRCGTWNETKKHNQYRTMKMKDPMTGEHFMDLEHEVRNLRHPHFLRPLVNRTGTIGLYCNQ